MIEKKKKLLEDQKPHSSPTQSRHCHEMHLQIIRPVIPHLSLFVSLSLSLSLSDVASDRYITLCPVQSSPLHQIPDLHLGMSMCSV